jgi:D-alanyl-D-alanine-carboxypeptidase/D-alanyl-D-alanine-endopeptidase
VADLVRREVEAALAEPPWMGLVVAAFDGSDEAALGRGRRSEADARAPDPDTLFEIGSITKAFTGILLALAVQEGRLELDTPVSACLPQGAALPEEGGGAITLGDLAAHASGLPRLPPNLNVLARDPYASYTRADLLAGLAATKLRFPRGEQSSYSNFGTGLLGECLALSEGRSYAEVLRERLLEPAGLHRTWLEVPEAHRHLLAPGHTVAAGKTLRPASSWTFDALAAAGGLRSTARELLRFLRLQTGTGPEALVAACRLSHRPRFVDPRGRMDVGLGWHVARGQSRERPSFVWHNGRTGGYRSFSGFVEGREAGVVVLANATREEVDLIGFRILEALARP